MRSQLALCRDLASKPDYLEAFADVGVVPPLVGLLEDPTDPATQVATEALTVLASSPPVRVQIRCVLACCAYARTLTELLQGRSRQLLPGCMPQHHAQQVTRSGCCREAGGISNLVGVLRQSADLAEDVVAALLQALLALAADEESQRLVTTAGGLPCIVRLLSQAPSQVQAFCS